MLHIESCPTGTFRLHLLGFFLLLLYPNIGLFLLEQCSSVCPRLGLQSRREIVSASEIPVKVSDIEPSDTVTQECRNAGIT